MSRTLVRVLGGAITLALFAAACGGSDGAQGADDGSGAAGSEATEGSIARDYDLSGASFEVGSKEFTENDILGQIAILALEAAGAEVTDQTGLIGSATVREALTSGEIDMYWEYTGTGWVNYLQHTTEQVPDDLDEQLAAEDLEKNQVKWLQPAPMNDTYAIAVTKAFADENGVTKLSDVSELEDPRICAASEFLQRDDGLPGLEETYGVDFAVSEMDLGLVYTQLASECEFGEVFSTDGRILANDLLVLEDDKDFFVPFNAALTMRADVFDEHPQLEEMFGKISAKLDNDTITALNASVDVDGESVEDAARSFMVDNGFIAG
jgi:osmoprotectant transport system substrate-binding protein